MGHSLFWTLLNLVTNCHFFKFQRLFQLEITPPNWNILLLLKTPFLISLDKVVLLKFLRNLSSSILCPLLFRNLAKSVPRRFCVQLTTCFPLTSSRAIIMWTFFLTTVNTFLFRGLFRAVVLGFLNLQCLLLASAQHLSFYDIVQASG